jgi:hypothetical protein
MYIYIVYIYILYVYNMYIYMCVCVCICVKIYIYIFICMYIYILCLISDYLYFWDRYQIHDINQHCFPGEKLWESTPASKAPQQEDMRKQFSDSVAGLSVFQSWDDPKRLSSRLKHGTTPRSRHVRMEHTKCCLKLLNSWMWFDQWLQGVLGY